MSFFRSRTLRYQSPPPEMTLADGLREFKDSNPQLFSAKQMSDDSLELFVRHDLTHVLFGLDTNLLDEAMADMWSVVGTNVGWKRYAHYLTTVKEAQDVVKAMGWFKLALLSVFSIPWIVRVLLVSRRMVRKLSWDDLPKLKDRPIREVRAEYNIHV